MRYSVGENSETSGEEEGIAGIRKDSWEKEEKLGGV